MKIFFEIIFQNLFMYFLFFMLITNASAEVNLPTLVKGVKPAVVTVITYDNNKKRLGQGTGFFINKMGHEMCYAVIDLNFIG